MTNVRDTIQQGDVGQAVTRIKCQLSDVAFDRACFIDHALATAKGIISKAGDISDARKNGHVGAKVKPLIFDARVAQNARARQTVTERKGIGSHAGNTGGNRDVRQTGIIYKRIRSDPDDRQAVDRRGNHHRASRAGVAGDRAGAIAIVGVGVLRPGGLDQTEQRHDQSYEREGF